MASDLPPESATRGSAPTDASVAGANAAALGCALVLESAPLQRHLLKRLLRRHGYARVLEAETVTEALALIRGEPVTLVLTPWAAPGMTGVPLLRALQRPPKDRPGAGAVPAVVLLDEGLPQQHVVSAVKAGIVGRLPVPADAEGLRRVLGRLG